ncbi:hypothetical protein HOE22_01880 [Candidatus Woesearchaeota archaeon]|jgi:hypothetical protein|nr:hypothetical protein [Candidatus Woesearchaeota archaeon]MBT7556952.1 hypothetical protein [Candidatus Woesearchaeota archaeon]
MKLEGLKKYIAKTVREEVQKEINKIFITEGKSIKTKTKPKVVSTPKVTEEPVVYSKDKTLNKILNETAGFKGAPKEGFEDYPTLSGETFDSSRTAELLGYGDIRGAGSDEQRREIGAVQTIKSVPGVRVEDVPQATQDALTRDYSSLIKAMDKKNK